jgi:hypothetical protein
MLHLLPEDHKKKVVKEYHMRLAVILFTSVIFIMVVSAVLAIPAYVVSYGKYAEIVAQKSGIDFEIAKIEKEDSSKEVKELTDMVDLIKNNNTLVYPTDVVEQIILQKPKGITISNFTYTPSADGQVVIDISGESATRQNLAEFSEILKKIENFSGVIIPISSFAKDRDIEFNLKINVSGPYKESAVKAT